VLVIVRLPVLRALLLPELVRSEAERLPQFVKKIAAIEILRSETSLLARVNKGDLPNAWVLQAE